ncbi:hypothetical protein PHISP_08107 [Aspergillus sp. HF37]|nr:hypothetical protein PHISP_08107 [Aspergillus sp. HF37]
MVTTRGSKRKRDNNNNHHPETNTSKDPPPAGIIHTIGHGTRPLSSLLSLLHSANTTKLLDVRSIPRSRTNPQFNRDALHTSTELAAHGIEYIWLGAELGGRRNKGKQPGGVDRHSALRVAAFRNYAGYMSTSGFWDGMRVLERLAGEVANEGNAGTVAIMCSETLWWKCHRRMISDALVVRGWEVRHLGVQKVPLVHRMWDIARVGDDGELVYDDNK